MIDFNCKLCYNINIIKYRIINKIILHHTAGKQDINNPNEIGGSYDFYNEIITPTKVFKQNNTLFNRGSFKSYDIVLTGDFRTDIPTKYQKIKLNELLKGLKQPVIPHKYVKFYGGTNGVLETECPANLVELLSKQFNITIVSDREHNTSELDVLISKYSRERVNIRWVYKDKAITKNGQQNVLTGDEMLGYCKRLDTKGEIVIFFYKSTTTWRSTHYNSKRNQAMISIPHQTTPKTIIFELSHAIQKWFNRNRGELSPVKIEDRWPIDDDLIFNKYDLVTQWLPIMEPLENNMVLTKEEVLKLQTLEGYSDEEGAEYWSGKELSEYLTARFKDKIKELKKYG